MRKIILNKTYLLLTLFTGMALASCLKDKGYENGEYQTINSNVEGQEWISIPLAARRPNTIGVESKNGFQDVNLFPVSYDYKDPAGQDITVTVAVNNNLLADQAPDAVPLPASAYNVTANTITIPAGQRVSEPFKFGLNTGALDPSKKYAIGFSITSVSKSGVGIPSNMKDVVFVFTIKNKYDGIYSIRVRMDLPADRSADWTRTPYTYPYDIDLITTGPNTVVWVNEAFGAGYHPLRTPGVSGFGQTEPIFTFDENDKLVSVSNGMAGGSLGRDFQIISSGTDPKTGVTINNRYDPATKKIYAAFTMMQNGYEPFAIFDTLTYLRARP